MAHRVFVIGIDAATFDIITPLMEQGLLPAFEYLLKNGASGRLKSTIPAVTSPAWVSLVTGKNPGKHGIFDFFASPTYGYSRTVLNAKYLKSKTIWQLLSETGKKVGIVNVPMSYPAEKVNGFMIPGLQLGLDSEKNFSYPFNLLQELKEVIGDYRVSYGDPLCLFADRYDNFLDEWRKIVKIREKAILYLMQNYEWDLFMGVFFYIDQIQHYFWKFYDRTHPLYKPSKYDRIIPEFYQYVDNSIGKILKKIDNNTLVMVVSDHGAVGIHKILYMNNWLNKNGLLAFKKQYLPLWQNRLPHLAYKILEKLKIKAIEWTLPLRYIPIYGNKIDPRLGLKVNKLIDWKHTLAFAGSYTEQGIYINLKGRNPEGVVEPGAEYERLREEIIEKLLDLRDPDTGERISTHIWKREEIYSGPYVNLAPDILLEMKKWTYIFRPEIHKKQLFFDESRFSGGHNEYGVFIIKGPGIKQGVTLNNLDIVDIAPTILYAMGFIPPEDMDGRIIREAFDDLTFGEGRRDNLTLIHYKPEEKIRLDTKEDKAAKEKLRSLGYIG